MLEEERRREKSALESAHEKTSEDHALILSERDALKARVSDLEQFLAAAQADLDLANTDCSRALLANENLQRALEDIQSERDAELAMLTDQQKASEEAITAAHAASLEAMREANVADMRDVQYAADKSVQNALAELDKMEATILVSAFIQYSLYFLHDVLVKSHHCCHDFHAYDIERNAEKTI